jgi:hypothetical protein
MNYVRILIATLVLPLAAGLSVSLLDVILNLGKNVSQQAVPFWIGAVSYFFFQVIFARPVRTYVFGHELTHALAGLLSGARLKKFNVTAKGGSVVLTKTNIFITLAPYFIPIYTFFLVLIYWAACKFWPLQQYQPVFLFFSGFTLAFHFGLTHFALMQGQSDLKQFGVFFSSVFILVVNCLVMIALLKFLFPREVGLKSYFIESWKTTNIIVVYIINTGKQIWLYSR